MVASETLSARAASATVSSPSPGSRSSRAFQRWYLATESDLPGNAQAICAIMRSLWPHDAFAIQREGEFLSAAARRTGDTRAGRGLIDDPGHHGALHGAEVHHVPHAPPGDQPGDAEG